MLKVSMMCLHPYETKLNQKHTADNNANKTGLASPTRNKGREGLASPPH